MKKRISFLISLLVSLAPYLEASSNEAANLDFDSFDITSTFLKVDPDDPFETDYYGDVTVWGVNSKTDKRTKLSTRRYSNWVGSGSAYVNSMTSELLIPTGTNGGQPGDGDTEAYNWITNSWRTIQGQSLNPISVPSASQNPANDCNQLGNGSGSIVVCPPDSDEIQAIHMNGSPLIGKNENNEIHIGENSLITIEQNGQQKLYAKDANGSAIPINISEGSDLLIDGVSVSQSLTTKASNIQTNKNNIAINASNIHANSRSISRNSSDIQRNKDNINDLGYGVAGATALTAALSSLPIASYDAPISCGIGTGGYSSRFAMGLGCAARVNKRLSLNVGGSHVFGGSSDYGGGSLGTIAARGGFAFKLGTIHKTSSLDGEELQSQLDEVKRENASIREENRAVRDENRAIRNENKELIARLERLEAIALGRESSITKASLK